MRFTPQTAEQIADSKPSSGFEPFPPGEYDFEVIEAKDTTSSAGNEMIALNMKIYNTEGSFRFVRDFIVSSAVWKLHQLARAVSLDAEYESGVIEAYMIEGKAGRAKVKIEAGQGGYGPQNKIAEYIAATVKMSPATTAKYTSKQLVDLDDDIPF